MKREGVPRGSTRLGQLNSRVPRGNLPLVHVSKWAPPWHKSLTGGPHLSATWQSASGPPHPTLCHMAQPQQATSIRLCHMAQPEEATSPSSVPHGITPQSHLNINMPHGSTAGHTHQQAQSYSITHGSYLLDKVSTVDPT
jgi:hypothetical protein